MVAVAVLVGCGSSGGEGAAPATTGLRAPVADLNGEWRITESGVSDCPGRESYSNGPSQISIAQNGNAVSVTTPAGTFSGTIDGDRLAWTGSYVAAGGTTTIDSMSLTVAQDGERFSGSAQWSWTDGDTRCSGTSQAINATRLPAPAPAPASPSGLSANPVSSSSVALVWNDNSDNELGFKLERRMAGGGSFTQVALLPADVTGHVDGGLDALTSYDYRLRAYNAGGDSPYSNVVTVTTLAAPVPAPLPPSDLSGTAESAERVRLQWRDNSANETGFKIERSRRADRDFAQIAQVDADDTSYTDGGREGATTYYYRVRATNATGDSAYSNVASVTTPAPLVAPKQPEDLRASAAASDRVELRWRDRSDNETGFKIERSRSRNDGYSQIAVVGANTETFTDTGLERLTRYYYRVRATNEAGDSDYSNVDRATTLPFDF